MLTSEDVSLFWDRFTGWIFSQKTETVILILFMGFLGYLFVRTLDENERLRNQIIELSKQR